MYITNQSQLKEFVERAQQSSVLAIDTEFLREKTFWPKLCLLQLGTETECVAVDPFKVHDLTPLIPLLENENIMKLVHAGNEDLGILYRELGVLPHPLFDTQVAAALIGQTLKIGYAALVHSEIGVRLKKTDSFTDWSARPLADSQLDYALDDVRYLPPVYQSMKEKLEAKGRLKWLDAEFKELLNPERYEVHPRERYRKLRRINQLRSRQLAAAREVAAWREEMAIKRDIPRKWVMSDEQIVEACKREPRNLDSLFMVRGMRDSLSTADARQVLAAVDRGLSLPPEEWPEQTNSGKREHNVDAQVDLMTSLVRLRASENDIALTVLASHDDLVDVARGYFDKSEVMRGWRKEIVGDELKALYNGEISLTLEHGVMKVTKQPRSN